MTELFTAIDVGKGDAFYYRRGEITILVDGGKAQAAFPKRLRRHTAGRRLDIVVVTHNDDDHTGGIIGLLKKDPCSIRQLWLPAHWAYRAKDLLKNAHLFFLELAGNILETDQGLKIKMEPDELTSSRTSERREANFVMNDGRHFRVDDGTLRSCGFYRKVWSAGNDSQRYVWNGSLGKHAYDAIRSIEDAGRRFTYAQARQYANLVPKMENIEQIYRLALRNNIKVRWFDVHAYETSQQKVPFGGNSGVLEPLNSRETYSIRTCSSSELSALEFALLTIENRTALIFFAPQTEDYCGVIFNSDATFDVNSAWFIRAHGILRKPLIATAPHHGSKDAENTRVYGRVHGLHMNPAMVTWIRSDQATQQRPCVEYITAPGPKYCTICNTSYGIKHQALPLASTSGTWGLCIAVRRCTCV